MDQTLKDNYKKYFPLISGIALAGFIIWFYWPVLTKLFHQISNDEDYSFGLLLPIVMAYVIYLKIPELRRTSFESSWVGLIILFIGIALYIISELAADLYIGRLSFIVCIAGVIVLTGGFKLARFFAFPLLLMLLMIPLPQLIQIKLTLPMRLLSSKIAAVLLHMMGVAVHLQGNILDLGVRQMQVVDACSGLRYVLSIVALGAIFCYFFQRQIWKIVILVLCTIPAAIFANSLRLAVMGIYPIFLEGFWHDFSGWLIFVFCLAVLVSVNAVLNYFSPPPEQPADVPGGAIVAETPGVQEKFIGLYVLLAIIMIISTSPAIKRISQVTPVPPLQKFDTFPMQIGSWQGRPIPLDAEMIRRTHVDDYLNADFVSGGEPPVSLWIAYYETQRRADGYIPSPSRCLPTAGFLTLDSRIETILPGLTVNYAVMEYQGRKILVYFWYKQRGRSLTSEYLHKLYIGYDGIMRQRTDGALIRLITPVIPNLEEAQKRINSFAEELLPILNEFIPN